jgi:hypothetical protein
LQDKEQHVALEEERERQNSSADLLAPTITATIRDGTQVASTVEGDASGPSSTLSETGGAPSDTIEGTRDLSAKINCDSISVSC